MKTSKKICRYLDIPIQHSEDSILKKMNRSARNDTILQLVEKLRREIPNIVLRTTLIVGFPGETEEDFQGLKNFVQEMQFDKLGVFEYSQEEGTPAAEMENQIEASVKKSRKESVMQLQQRISAEIQQKHIGSIKHVLVEERLSESENFHEYAGRTEQDAPEIDGAVYFTSKNLIAPGEILPVKITGALEYDLMGEAINET